MRRTGKGLLARVRATVAILALLSCVSGCDKLSSADAHMQRAHAALDHGDPRTASIEAHNVLRRRPNDVEARLLLVRSSLQLGDSQGAQVALEQAARDQAPTAEVSRLREQIGQALDTKRPLHPQLVQGLELLRDGRFSQAEAHLEQARRLPAIDLPVPQRALMLAGLVEVQLAQNQLVKAQATHRELTQLLPAAAPTRLLAARLLLASGQPIEGAAELQRLVTADPEYAPGRLWLARTLLAQGNLLQAESQLKAVLSRMPKQPEALALLTQVQQRTAKPEDIDNPLILNNLAWLYFEQGDPRAETLARRAYALAPHNPAVTDTYGWILLQKKELNRAMPLLAAAARGAPRVSEIQYHYAVGLIAAGRPAEARAALEPLLAGNRTFPRRREAQDLLESLPP